jgi:hypothetical protein
MRLYEIRFPGMLHAYEPSTLFRYIVCQLHFRLLVPIGLCALAQYPYRPVQIVLRLYRSPAEVLAGFDVDAPCCAYDGTSTSHCRPLLLSDTFIGNRVWANPRAIVAMMRQCNTVDMTRRSPSYEVRLSKYSARGYEVFVPSLRRSDVDPTVRPFAFIITNS